MIKIADIIFSQHNNVKLRLTGPMEPLTVPGIVDLFRHILRYKDKVSELVLMTNFSLEAKAKSILEMGWGKKLTVIISMHILDEKFDPFKITELFRVGVTNNIHMDSHIVPSPLVKTFWREYMEFFGICGIRVRDVPFIAERSNGKEVYKYDLPDNYRPKHYDAVKSYVKHFKEMIPISVSDTKFVKECLKMNPIPEDIIELKSQKAGDE